MTQTTSLSIFALVVRVRVLGRGRHVSQRHVSDITHHVHCAFTHSRVRKQSKHQRWQVRLATDTIATIPYVRVLRSPSEYSSTHAIEPLLGDRQPNTCFLPSNRPRSSTPLLGHPNLSNGNPRNMNYPTHSLTRLAFSFPNIVTLVERDATMTMNTTNIKAFIYNLGDPAAPPHHTTLFHRKKSTLL